jgi:hypothetical protein
VPDAGRLPRNIFHPVQIGCELACLQQQFSFHNRFDSMSVVTRVISSRKLYGHS